MPPIKGSPDAAATYLRGVCPRWDVPPGPAGDETSGRSSAARRSPALGLTLGSGLGVLAEQMEDSVVVPYKDVPGMAASTAPGHRGEFRVGVWRGVPVIALSGRLHAYEGHDPATLTYPVEVLAAMGVSHLVVSCAAGGLNPRFRVGELVAIDEHLSWLGGRMGACPQLLGDAGHGGSAGDALPPVPLPGMATCDPGLLQAAIEAAFDHSFVLHRGTYLAVTGPSYESRAECRMMRGLAVDVVGMSTVPELLVASRLGLAVLGVAVVTNMAVPDAGGVADHGQVLASSKRAAGRLTRVVERILQSIRPDAT